MNHIWFSTRLLSLGCSERAGKLQRFCTSFRECRQDEIEQFTKKNNLPLMSENRNTYYKNHPEFFRDINNHNSEGADEFSKRIYSLFKQEKDDDWS